MIQKAISTQYPPTAQLAAYYTEAEASEARGARRRFLRLGEAGGAGPRLATPRQPWPPGLATRRGPRPPAPRRASHGGDRGAVPTPTVWPVPRTLVRDTTPGRVRPGSARRSQGWHGCSRGAGQSHAPPRGRSFLEPRAPRPAPRARGARFWRPAPHALPTVPTGRSFLAPRAPAAPAPLPSLAVGCCGGAASAVGYRRGAVSMSPPCNLSGAAAAPPNSRCPACATAVASAQRESRRGA